MEKDIYLTPEGFLKLEEELNYLTQTKRYEIIEEIKMARSFGDLSENFEYASARDDQAKIEARIAELEVLINKAKIITDTNNGTVGLGSTVSIKYVADGEVEEYKIVGFEEADPFNNLISNESPIAKAIIGKKVSEVVSVESPTGNYEVEILNVY